MFFTGNKAAPGRSFIFFILFLERGSCRLRGNSDLKLKFLDGRLETGGLLPARWRGETIGAKGWFFLYLNEVFCFSAYTAWAYLRLKRNMTKA